MKTSDEELEEDVFRARKAELISGAGNIFFSTGATNQELHIAGHKLIFEWQRHARHYLEIIKV